MVDVGKLFESFPIITTCNLVAGSCFVGTNESLYDEAVRELESTGEKSTGICTGCTAAGRHSIAELEVDWKHVI